MDNIRYNRICNQLAINMIHDPDYLPFDSCMDILMEDSICIAHITKHTSHLYPCRACETFESTDWYTEDKLQMARFEMNIRGKWAFWTAVYGRFEEHLNLSQQLDMFEFDARDLEERVEALYTPTETDGEDNDPE